MIAQIKFVAGEIMVLLDRLEGPLHTEDIKCRINAPPDVILMSLGWLIREGYVYAIPRETGIEVMRIGNETNEEMQERALDLNAVTV
ncbi:MAG: hypothetical protein JW893_05570 [Candidatus Omnitrophica bacterium]|nr:hypothetical protein [Candidatus Omnitrophota bacterium]